MNRAGKTQGANRGEVTNLTPIALALHKTADHRFGYKVLAIGVGLQGPGRPPFLPVKSEAPRCGQSFKHNLLNTPRRPGLMRLSQIK